MSARIAAHRGDQPVDLPSIRPEAPAGTPNCSTTEAAATHVDSSAHGDRNVPCCPQGPRQDTIAGNVPADAATLCAHGSIGQCLQAEDESEAGQRAAEERQATGFAHSRAESLGQSLAAKENGVAGQKAAEAASLDIWLLPKEELSVHSMQQGRENAAPQTPDLSPRTPEVVRESAAASATPVARSSRLSRPPASAPGGLTSVGSAQVDDDPDASSAAAVDEGTRRSWPAVTAPEEAAARTPAQTGAPAGAGSAAGTVPARKPHEQLEAVRQLAGQAARVQRRARRLVNGCTGQKVAQVSSLSCKMHAAIDCPQKAHIRMEVLGGDNNVGCLCRDQVTRWQTLLESVAQTPRRQPNVHAGRTDSGQGHPPLRRYLLEAWRPSVPFVVCFYV